MDSGPIQSVVRHLRRLAAPKPGPPSSDAELVARYAGQRDEAAFAEIVQRHGPLVWALCRSGLPAADADDAFQATFLVLARQARRIRKPGALACWLSGVARRVVKSALARDARRRAVEARAEARTTVSQSDDLERQEWRAVLDEELYRLPEKYRLPLLLCYYQGLTNEEAAHRLGWPHGTVCGRLARARDLLRRRLARRGVALAVGAVAVGTAGPPSELLAATARAWGLCGGSVAVGGVVNGSVTQIAEEVMHAMWLGKVKALAAGVLAVVVLGSGAAGWSLVPTKAQGEKAARNGIPQATPPAPGVAPQAVNQTITSELTPGEAVQFIREAAKPSPLAEAAATDDELKALRKERHRLACRELQLKFERYVQGIRGETVIGLLDVLKRFVESETALSQRPEDHIKAYERAAAIAQVTANLAQKKFESGLMAETETTHIRYADRDLRIKLLELKAQKSAKP
jgi:RNA polymerase sigma factor (sigma-70 family)